VIKLIVAVKRRPDLSVAAWRRHMREVHAPLVRDHPASQRHLTRYVQCFADDSEYADGNEPAFDATSELFFETLADKDAWLADPSYQAEVFQDGAAHADMSRTLFVTTQGEERV
jgi:uncharacterized protein (TIGR02118 family)